MTDVAYEVVEITDGEQTITLEGGRTFVAKCEVENILIVGIPSDLFHTASYEAFIDLRGKLEAALRERGFKGELLMVEDSLKFMKLRRVGDDVTLPS